jgi:hypothetical protein
VLRSHTILALEKTVCESVFVRFGAAPTTVQWYFQQILPLAKCDAEDGRVVGRMLVDLVSRKPKDLPHAIREFANRTTMLRKCDFRHIGDMLAAVLSINADGDSDQTPHKVAACDPASVTVEHAAAIGSMLARSSHSAHMPAATLKKVVMSCAVLRTMKSSYVWFVPMLEVLTAYKAKQAHRSTLGSRLSLIVAAEAPNSSVEADEADEERSFSSVVWLNVHTFAAPTGNCMAPCSEIPRSRVSHTPPQVPVDAFVSEVVDATLDETVPADDSWRGSNVASDSEVRCTSSGSATHGCDAMPAALGAWPLLRGLV